MEIAAFAKAVKAQAARLPITHREGAAFAFLGLLGLTWFIYWPGLFGDFLLDDFQNLQRLSAVHDPITLQKLVAFLLDGIGLLGRPVALLSFVFQYASWPRDPASFKYVNLMLHLLNGSFIFWLLLKLDKLLSYPAKPTSATALIATAVWLVHPIQVSTVLYVVQRMTELCALFTILGLLAYLNGREYLLKGRQLTGYIWLTGGTFLGTVLATLSKENGVLLLVYVVVLEMTLLHALPKLRRWWLWQAFFIYLPILLLGGYFLWNMNGLLAGYQIRNFDLGERLLTESRVLADYLGKIFFPNPRAFGLFFDDYTVSRGLLAPPATLASMLFIGGLLVAAIIYRKRQPIFAFGVLWFFAGHLIESTVIPLELYFEHRNYLPLLGPVFAASYYALRLPLSARLRKPAVVAGVALLGLFAAITWNEARLWGDPFRQMVMWAAEKPNSRRAQENKAIMYVRIGDNPEAIKIYRHLAEQYPRDAGPYMEWLELNCLDASLPVPDQALLTAKLRVSEFSYVPLVVLERIVESREQGRCTGLTYQYLIQLIEPLIQNPAFQSQQNRLFAYRGRLHAVEGSLDPAMADLDHAYALYPVPEIPLLQTQWLASAGLYDDALRYLKLADQISKRRMLEHWLVAQDIGDLEAAIKLSKKQQMQQPKVGKGKDR